MGLVFRLTMSGGIWLNSKLELLRNLFSKEYKQINDPFKRIRIIYTWVP